MSNVGNPEVRARSRDTSNTDTKPTAETARSIAGDKNHADDRRARNRSRTVATTRGRAGTSLLIPNPIKKMAIQLKRQLRARGVGAQLKFSLTRKCLAGLLDQRARIGQEPRADSARIACAFKTRLRDSARPLLPSNPFPRRERASTPIYVIHSPFIRRKRKRGGEGEKNHNAR